MDENQFGGGVMHGRFFSPAEEWMIRTYFPHVLTSELAARLGRSYSSTSQRAHKLGVRKTSAFMEEMLRECGRRATLDGAATRFKKGIIPANKGLRMPGWGPGRMKQTQFKKGLLPVNTMPLWSFRFVDGYLMLKTGAPTPKPTNGWEYVHKLVWEQAKGPLPDWREARIWWKDGDHANCSLANLELVKGSDHVARTTVHNLPKPLALAIQLKGALKRRIRSMEEEANAEEHNGRSPQPPVCDDRSLAG